MGKIYQTYLDTCRPLRSPPGPRNSPSNTLCIQLYRCRQCKAHLCRPDDIVSRGFHGKHGKAYLTSAVENTFLGEAEDRLLLTGLHTICDVYCTLYAHEELQKFKEGHFILEKAKIKSVRSRRDIISSSLNDDADIRLNGTDFDCTDANDDDDDDIARKMLL